MRLLRQHPGISFGIHLTLVCDTARGRWGPLTDRKLVPSLLDQAGELFTPGQVLRLLARARLDEAEREFRAQIDAVAGAGLTPTHLDWHCLADGGAGLSEWAVHPGLGNQESRALDLDGWRVRRTDYEFLTSPAARALLQQEGIVTIDYSTIQLAWRQASRPR